MAGQPARGDRPIVLLLVACGADRCCRAPRLLACARRDRFAASPKAVDAEVEQLLLAAIASAQAPTDDMARIAPTAPVLDHRLRAAIAYMREHVTEPLAVEEVASRVHLSRGHFFALFRQQLNTTPQVFWSAVRVEEAARRMVQQDASLTEVAMELGFSTPGNFSRFFREHMGTTPSRYRKAAIGVAPHLLTGVP